MLVPWSVVARLSVSEPPKSVGLDPEPPPSLPIVTVPEPRALTTMLLLGSELLLISRATLDEPVVASPRVIVPVPAPALALRRSVPAETVTPPAKVLAPPSVRVVAAPCFTIEPVPEITPLSVWLVEVEKSRVPSLAMVPA